MALADEIDADGMTLIELTIGMLLSLLLLGVFGSAWIGAMTRSRRADDQLRRQQSFHGALQQLVTDRGAAPQDGGDPGLVYEGEAWVIGGWNEHGTLRHRLIEDGERWVWQRDATAAGGVRSVLMREHGSVPSMSSDPDETEAAARFREPVRHLSATAQGRLWLQLPQNVAAQDIEGVWLFANGEPLPVMVAERLGGLLLLAPPPLHTPASVALIEFTEDIALPSSAPPRRR